MATIERDFGLKADEQGFLLGVKKLGQDVASIDTNVSRIIDILSHAPVQDFKDIIQQSQLSSDVAKIAVSSTALLEENKKLVTLLSSRTMGRGKAKKPPSSGDTAPPVVDLNHPNRPPQSPPSVQPPSPTEQSPNGNPTIEPPNGQPPTEPPAPVQEPPSSGSNDTEKKGFLSKIVQAIKSGFSGDSSSIDPSIEAMREVGQVLEPVGKVAEFTLRPFGFRNKEKNKPLSRDEEKHNKGVIKLLKKIVSLLSGGAGAGNGGDSGSGGLGSGVMGGLAAIIATSLGGFLKKGLGGLGGFLKKGLGGLGGLLKFGKGIPLIGTALSALTLSDWDKQNTEQRGESVGSISGGVIGGALGSFLGPVGTMAGAAIGSWVGSKLGGIVAPAFSEWTDSLIKADIPTRLSNAWDTFTSGLGNYFSEKWNNTKEHVKKAANDVKDTTGSVGDFAAYQADKALALLGNEAAKERLAQRERGEIGFTPTNYQAKTTNNTSLGQVAADTGEALSTQPNNKKQSDIVKILVNKKDNSNTVQLADGSIVKRTGNRNWRNNNSGNIEYGDLAKKHGALGSDGRFAIFPSYEAGRAAKEELIFESNRGRKLSTKGDYGAGLGYKDKTLMQTIAAYAPIEDRNDTKLYQQTVLAAVGGANKRMADYTPDERARVMDAMEKMEGYRKGKEQVLQAATQQPSQAQKPTIVTINKTNEPIVNGLTTTPLAMLPKVQAPAFSLMRPTQKITTNPTAISQTQHKIAAPQIPKPESVKEPIGTPSPMMVRNVDNGQQITQNLSDRHLAHLVTGGLGMTDRWIR